MKSRKKPNFASKIGKFLIILLVFLVLYLFLVWFFPVIDFTGGIINDYLNKVSIVLGIKKNAIINVWEEEEIPPLVIDLYPEKNDVLTGKGSSNYRIYFSELFEGNVKKAKEYKYSIDKILSTFIKNAKKEINIAMHEIDSEIITSALIYAYKNNIDVRIVIEMDYVKNVSIKELIEIGIPVRTDGKSSLMHNKFLVIDEKFVWTGSYNATVRGSYYNNNNAICLLSRKLANYYNNEFDEMFYYGKFGASSPDDELPLPKVFIEKNIPKQNNKSVSNNTQKDLIEIETYFSPDINIIDKIVEVINLSKKSIHFLAFSFTNDRVSEALINKYKDGVNVSGIFESQQLSQYSEFDRLKNAGIDVKIDRNKYYNHHKIIIVDKQIVITGSANFSVNAEKRNDENILIIHDKDIASTYLKEFNRIYNKLEKIIK